MSQVFTIEFPAEIWVTSNHRLHPLKKNSYTKALRERAYYLARSAKLTPMGEAVIIAQIRRPTGGRFDPPNAWPTVKPIIDGMVAAGIFPDDDSVHIPLTGFTEGPKWPTPRAYCARLTLINPDTPTTLRELINL